MKIADQKVKIFLKDIAANKPTPGGGAVAAFTGAVAASLSEMVCGLTLSKKGYEKYQSTVAKIGKESRVAKEKLLKLADSDVKAFDEVMLAYRSKDSKKIKKALRHAMDVPSEVKNISEKVNEMARKLTKIGNKNAISDAKTAVYLSQAASKSAYENVKINKAFLKKIT